MVYLSPTSAIHLQERKKFKYHDSSLYMKANSFINSPSHQLAVFTLQVRPQQVRIQQLAKVLHSQHLLPESILKHHQHFLQALPQWPRSANPSSAATALSLSPMHIPTPSCTTIQTEGFTTPFFVPLSPLQFGDNTRWNLWLSFKGSSTKGRGRQRNLWRRLTP